MACGSSIFLLCSLPSFIVVHYVRDCSCTTESFMQSDRWGVGTNECTVHVHNVAKS